MPDTGAPSSGMTAVQRAALAMINAEREWDELGPPFASITSVAPDTRFRWVALAAIARAEIEADRSLRVTAAGRNTVPLPNVDDL